jgi:nucleotide-binding universal stress UspA family protein
VPSDVIILRAGDKVPADRRLLNTVNLPFVTALGTAMPAQATVPTDKLRAAGLSTSNVTREGSPGRVLLDEVEKWGADALFVGTRDLHGMKHFLHGSVSSTVAAHAACSVEVVRPGRSTATVRG